MHDQQERERIEWQKQQNHQKRMQEDPVKRKLASLSKAIAEGAMNFEGIDPNKMALVNQFEKNLDTRVKCDHCGRKFEHLVLERHLPHCAAKKKLLGRGFK